MLSRTALPSWWGRGHLDTWKPNQILFYGPSLWNEDETDGLGKLFPSQDRVFSGMRLFLMTMQSPKQS